MKKNIIVSLVVTALYAFIYYYFMYPPINIHAASFLFYIFTIFIVFIIFHSSISFSSIVKDIGKGKFHELFMIRSLIIIPIFFIGIIVVNVIVSPLFQSKEYYNRIKIDDGDFKEEVKEVDFNKLPLLDRDSTLKIGDRTMGGMSDLVSQFDVSEEYTQINYQDEIVRVTPLEYHGLIKWINNMKNGIPGYITVNSTTGEAKLVRLSKGMKYVPSAYFQKNLYRKLQMSYPFKTFDSINFEIDNNGNPYWIASVVKYVGVEKRRDVVGAVIFNPVNGNSKYYSLKKIPEWVDHVYEADLILEQVRDWGHYKNGFFNSFIGQKGVVEPTRGYNYLAQDDDIYLYTGITSVISDESNIGFILTNLRTKATKFYQVAGAEEYSAMDSAEGQVQQMKYQSTFPLLINLNNKPTYLVSLKDNAGLVKMYGFIDVIDYQKVVVTDSSKGIIKAAEAYLGDAVDSSSDLASKDIIVHSVTNALIDGNTYYYFMDEDNNKYKVSIKVDKDNLPFLKEDDHITIYFVNSLVDSKVISIKKIDFDKK